MAGIKISALPAATDAQLTDVFPADQLPGPITRKITLEQVQTLFQSSDVSSIQGTLNGVLVNGTVGTPQTGALILTTPQAIGTTSTPVFNALTVNGTISNATFVNDNTGNPILGFSSTASSVNYLNILNNITSVAPQLQALGSDSNIDVNIVPKGTGTLHTNTTSNIGMYFTTGTTLQHQTQFAFANTANSWTATFPDKSGTVAFTSDIPSVTPSALTKTDDTNVTLTLGGTPNTALLQATSITAGWTGQLSIARGGTGISSLGTGVQTALGQNVSGSGGMALVNSPSFTTPGIGAASATSINFGGSTLSNYLEGTWTPVLTGSGGGSATYAALSQVGFYTRIGNRVLFDLYIVITASTLSGNISITGLPLAAGAENFTASIYASNLSATATPSLSVLLNAGSTALILNVFSAGTSTPLTATNLGTAATIIITGQYHI